MPALKNILNLGSSLWTAVSRYVMVRFQKLGSLKEMVELHFTEKFSP